MQVIQRFDDPRAVDPSVVGGKGANLARMTQAGFRVPTGFTIVAGAYIEFFEAAGLRTGIDRLLADVDWDDPEQLDRRMLEIRGLILAADLPPDLTREIADAYAGLGEDSYVAVRSSGTKEDGAEASYAGLHDSFLDIRGPGHVLAAVTGCYASLWTARAAAYRHSAGLDHFDAPIAVVVQVMLEPEVAGVMLTANPLTTETDELVIDAAYGLGEGVVSGLVTPDQFIVKHGTLKVREKHLGSKELTIVRDPGISEGDISEGGTEGTKHLNTDVPARGRFCLSDDQLTELAAVGRRLQEHYDGLPQDIEWAYADGKFHVLQCRPLTGIEFSWDADVDLATWSDRPRDEADVLWTRDMADEGWTGAITPLMYSFRADSWVQGHAVAAQQWGHRDLATAPYFKFHKSEAYYNCEIERGILERTMPPVLRRKHVSGLAKLPPDWREETQAKPLSYLELAKVYARVEAVAPQFQEGFRIHESYMTPESIAEASGLTDGETRALSDRELIRYLNGQIEWESVYMIRQWTWFFNYARDMFLLLSELLERWHDGDPQEALGALISGVPHRTRTLDMNHGLWELSEEIRHSPELIEAFRANEGASFFDVVRGTAAGDAFHEKYDAFLEEFGHRGHADRDIYFPRRLDDPGLDYNGIKPMIADALEDAGETIEHDDPVTKEEALTRQRDAATEAIVSGIRRQPFGSIKAEIFKWVLAYCQRFIMARDNERHYIDYATYSIRRGFIEVGRRLQDRGLLRTERDFFFLAKAELFEVLVGAAEHATGAGEDRWAKAGLRPVPVRRPARPLPEERA